LQDNFNIKIEGKSPAPLDDRGELWAWGQAHYIQYVYDLAFALDLNNTNQRFFFDVRTRLVRRALYLTQIEKHHDEYSPPANDYRDIRYGYLKTACKYMRKRYYRVRDD